MDKMDLALSEIGRVLKPGGLAWISEPVYAGELNEILRLFHDENGAGSGLCCNPALGQRRSPLTRQTTILFHPGHFEFFEHFEKRWIQVTHTDHRLFSPELHAAVRSRLEKHMTRQGADFSGPLRVDILRKG